MKIRNLLKKNIKIIIAFVIGLIISGSGVYAATVASSDVSYTNNSQSTVQGALNNLYNKVYQKVPPTTVKVAGNVFALKTGTSVYLCNSDTSGKLFCVRNGSSSDYEAKKTEMHSICTNVGGSIEVQSYYEVCWFSNGRFQVFSDGYAIAADASGSYRCDAYASGSVSC